MSNHTFADSTVSTVPAVFTREQAKASDQKLYELMIEQSKAQSFASVRLDGIHHAANDEYNRRYDRRSGWKLSAEDALAKVIDLSKNAEHEWDRRAAAQKLANYQEAVDAYKAATAAVEVQQGEWAAHGQWNRYSVVPGGHIHTDLDECHTFRYNIHGQRTTDVRWAFPVSGDSVEEAIEVYGSALCTHCFPSAPVERTTETVAVDESGNPLTRAQAQAIRDARKAEKDAKQAAKDAKRVLDPTTGTWVEYDGRELKTDVAVRNQILSLLEDIHYYGEGTGAFNRHETRREAADRLIAALAAKQDREFAEVRTEFQTKADKKHARR